MNGNSKTTDEAKKHGSVISITDVRSQKISETRSEGFERLRAKIKEQNNELSGTGPEGPSR